MTNEEAAVWFEARLKNIAMPGAREMHKMAISALRAQSSSEKPNNWISVEDRLPENGIDVLLYWSNDAQNEKYVDMERYHIDHWETLDRPRIRAIAWMPLPEPPEVKDGHY
jgi:hypothetical protein